MLDTQMLQLTNGNCDVAAASYECVCIRLKTKERQRERGGASAPFGSALLLLESWLHS